METLRRCPVCREEGHQHVLTCQDHTVTGETFGIVECEHCGFRFTNPRPRPDRIGQYYESENYTPHQDTGQNAIDTLYRWVRQYTLRSKRRLITDLVEDPPGRLLDFGCGTGDFLAHCQSQGWDACGLEPDETARTVAARQHGLPVEPPGRLQDVPSGHFDVITLWHVLEHVPDLTGTIEALNRTLAPSGTLVVAVPNWLSLDAQFYGEDWAAYDVPRHLSHFRPRDVRRLFARFDLEVAEVRPMRLDAFYVSLLSERYRDGWLLRAPLVALWSTLWAAQSPHRHSAQLYLIRDRTAS